MRLLHGYFPEPAFSPVKKAMVPVTPAVMIGAIITQKSFACSGVFIKTTPPKTDKIAQVTPTNQSTPTLTFTSPAARICAGVFGFDASTRAFCCHACNSDGCADELAEIVV